MNQNQESAYFVRNQTITIRTNPHPGLCLAEIDPLAKLIFLDQLITTIISTTCFTFMHIE